MVREFSIVQGSAKLNDDKQRRLMPTRAGRREREITQQWPEGQSTVEQICAATGGTKIARVTLQDQAVLASIRSTE